MNNGARTSQLVHIIERLRNADSEKEAEAEAFEIIENPEAIFDLFQIIESNEDKYTRQYAIVLIRHLLLKTPQADVYYWNAVKENFLKLIEGEPESLLRCNLAHAAIGILDLNSDIVPTQWPELGYFAMDMIHNPERLDLGFYLWKHLLSKKSVLAPIEEEGLLTRENVFQLAVDNFTNENPDVRIRAMKYFNAIEWILLDVSADVNVVIESILAAAHNAFYVLQDKEEASLIAKVMEDSLLCVLPFFNDLQERIQFADFALDVITEAELPPEFMVIASNIVNSASFILLDGTSKDNIQNLLVVAINYTLTMAQVDLLSQNFENLFVFIENISIIIEENFVAETVLNFAQQYKDSNEEHERVAALFLIEATLNGCQEKYALIMEYFIRIILEIITPESEFLFCYGCDLLVQIAEVLPVEMGTKIDKIIKYLWDYVENIKVAQTIDAILDKISVAPTDAYTYIGQFIELLDSLASENDQIIILNCIASFLSHVEPNEEYFAEIAQLLMAAIEENTDLWNCSFRCFKSLVTAAPESFVSDMETIVQVIMAALEEDNDELYYQPLCTLLKIVQFLPISLEPYLESIIPPLYEFFKDQIEMDKQEQEHAQSDEDKQPLGILTHLMGALFGAYPDAFGENAGDVVRLILASYEGKYNVQMSALKGIQEMAKGCHKLEIDLIPNAIMLLGCIKAQSSRTLISEIYTTAAVIMTIYYAEIEQSDADKISSTSLVGFGGELPDFLPFELASTIDPVIVPGLYRCINKLILLPSLDAPIEYAKLIAISVSYTKSFHVIAGHVNEVFAHIILNLSREEPEVLAGVLPAGTTTEEFVRQVGQAALSFTAYQTTFALGVRALTYLALATREDLHTAEHVDPSIGVALRYLSEEAAGEFAAEIPGMRDAFAGFFAAVLLTREGFDPPESVLAHWADTLAPTDGPLAEIAADAAFAALTQWRDVIEPRLPALSVRVMSMEPLWLSRAQSEEAVPALAEAAAAVPAEDALRFLGMDEAAMARLARNLEMFGSG